MAFNEKHPHYEHLREIISEHRTPIVFWIGAGISSDAGIPNWGQLRTQMANATLEDLVCMPKEEADEKEVELEYASSCESLWEAFEIIRNLLGEAGYKAFIRRQLGEKADSAIVPELHKLIWSHSSVKGVITLNIDGLEGKAHRLARFAEDIDLFHGKDIKNHLHTIQSKKPFIARLHGYHTDSTTWVFTQSDLDRQLKDPAYETAIQTLFTNYTIVFVGISADDTAAGGYLERLTRNGIDAGYHFWITDRTSHSTSKWYKNAGLLHVPYSIEEGETHTEVVKNILTSIFRYKSKEKTPPPVQYSGQYSETIPPLQELKILQEDQIRVNLNRYAKFLLDQNAGQTDTVEYQKFLEEYSSAIHQAWHLSTSDGYNSFFGYTTVEKIHSGSFSNVWRVIDCNGQYYALKIIQMDNIQKGPQLESFRRGVSSQKLLRSIENLDGIARIKDAFEIPPSVVMDFVEGENLQEVCDKPSFNFWIEGIPILINVCKEVSQAHSSRHGVLHRDIRPTNIMIPNYYLGNAAADYGEDPFAVKILNYDMSWHKDATGRVLSVDSGEIGYYAPEQLKEPDMQLARDARVDSYGIGMTILRLGSGKKPPISGSSSSNWFEQLSQLQKPRDLWFTAAHNYVKRVIKLSTAIETDDRITVSEIQSALENLLKVISGDTEQTPIEFFAEKLMYCVAGDDYEANPAGAQFSRESHSGRQYSLNAPIGSNEIFLDFTAQYTSNVDWGSVDKVMPRKLQSAKEKLQSGGWTVLAGTEYHQRVATMRAKVKLSQLRSDYGKIEKSLHEALLKVQIEH